MAKAPATYREALNNYLRAKAACLKDKATRASDPLTREILEARSSLLTGFSVSQQRV